MDWSVPSFIATRSGVLYPTWWFVSYRVTMFVHAPITLLEVYLASISTLLNLVLLRFQGMKTTPFDTHPKTMNAVTVFCLLLAYCTRLEHAGARVIEQPVSHFVHLFWSLAAASLLSLLLPDSIATLLYVFCVAPSAVGLLHYVAPVIWRKFRNFQGIHFLRRSFRNERQIEMLPI